MYGADAIHRLIASLDFLQAESLEQSPVEMWGHGTVEQEQAVSVYYMMVLHPCD